jgi:hypothetical protein
VELCIVYAFAAFKRVSKHGRLIMGMVGGVYNLRADSTWG